MQWVLMCLLCLGAPAAVADGLPESLEGLAPFLEDEARLTPAIRNLDRLHLMRVDALLEEAQDLMGQGEGEAARARRAEAAELLAKVRRAYEFGLDAYPESPALHTYFGELLYDRYGDQDTAIEHWRRALARDADFHRAHNNLALHLCHVGEYRGCIEHMDRALDGAPDHPDYLFNIVQFYLAHWPRVQEIRGWSAEKVYKTAMELSEKALAQQPGDFELLSDYAMNHFLAENFGVAPDWPAAAEAWAKAEERARTEDQRFNALLNQGRSWLRGGEHARARTAIDAALELRPDSTAARTLRDRLAE